MTKDANLHWFLLALLLLAGWLVWLLAPVLTPFLVGALLAYLGDPLTDRLEARGLSRTLSVVVVFVILFLSLSLALLVLLPLVQQQVVTLLRVLPDYLATLQTWLAPRLQAWFGLEPEALLGELRRLLIGNWQQAGGLAAWLAGSLGRSGMALATFVGNLLLIPVVTFYLLRDWDVLVARIDELLPRRIEPVVAKLARESDEVLGAFLRGQLSVMLALGLIYAVGLWFVGLELALLVGLLAGLFSFVPYMGFVFGILLAALAMLFQTHDPMDLIGVAVVFGVGQALEGMVLTPWLVGDRIGLHPVAVIFAVLAGGQLFGFIGVLLALPVAAVLAVLLRHLHERYRSSSLYGAAE